MKTAKPTLSNDGQLRVNVTVTPRLTCYEIAVLFASHNIDSEYLVDKAINSTATEIMKIVKAEILVSGLDLPHYRVSDELHDSERVLEELTQVIGEKLGFH